MGPSCGETGWSLLPPADTTKHPGIAAGALRHGICPIILSKPCRRQPLTGRRLPVTAAN
jgi:hypothetical protein